MKKLFFILLLTIPFITNAQNVDSTKASVNKMDESLSKIVEKTLAVAEKTGDFVIEQAPLVLKEFYKWQIFSNIFCIFMAIFIFLLGRYLPYLWLNKEKEDNEYIYNTSFFNRWGSEGAVLGYIVFAITSLSSAIMILCSIYDLIYIIVAPKLYLIDYFIK